MNFKVTLKLKIKAKNQKTIEKLNQKLILKLKIKSHFKP